MQKKNFVFVDSSNTRRRESRPSLLSLIVLAILVAGLLIVGVGLAFLLFAPLLLAAGAALALFALLVFCMLRLARGIGWSLSRLIKHFRQTAFSQALSPVVAALLRQIARQLVALLLDWLEQGGQQPKAHASRTAYRHRRSRSRLALHYS